MKKIFLLIISILLLVSIVGCKQESEPSPSEESMEEEGLGEQYTIAENLKDKMAIAEEQDVLKEAREWFGEFGEEQKGAYIYQHPHNTYIKINLGERPTGGYGIHVKDYDEDAYPRRITIEEIEPQEDAGVTQAMTYPSLILVIGSDMASQYEVQTAEGQTFDSEEELIFAALEMPEEGEEIENPVVLRGRIAAFEGAFVVRILDDQDEVIHEEHLQADSGGPYWGNFEGEIAYPQPEAEEGNLEVGEYSAKDGEYLLREKISVRF